MGLKQLFEKFYPFYVLLILMRLMYSLNQGEIHIWKKFLHAFIHINYSRKKAYICLYFFGLKEHWSFGCHGWMVVY